MKEDEITKITIDKQKFESLRNDPELIFVLHLARVFNALLFCLDSYKDYLSEDSPVASRQKQRSILLLIGFLHEAVNIINETVKTLSDKSIFDKTLGKIIKDPDFVDFNKDVLLKIRNTSSFHFGNKVVTQTLKELNLSEYVLISFEKTNAVKRFYDLADELDFNFLVKDGRTPEQKIKTIKEIFSLTMRFTKEFTQSGEEFIYQTYLKLTK